nr:MAG TPA: hypothetical protein [Caudoviricetes sp.]DAT89154.1 MAG TPA: hypothetical protein [Caudoviricetes sp.]
MSAIYVLAQGVYQYVPHIKCINTYLVIYY